MSALGRGCVKTQCYFEFGGLPTNTEPEIIEYSAFWKADVLRAGPVLRFYTASVAYRRVSNRSKAVVHQAPKSTRPRASLFDYPVDAQHEGPRYREAQRLRDLAVNDHLERGRLFHWEVGSARPFQI